MVTVTTRWMYVGALTEVREAIGPSPNVAVSVMKYSVLSGLFANTEYVLYTTVSLPSATLQQAVTKTVSRPQTASITLKGHPLVSICI